MKMKIVDVIRKTSDEQIAKIIGTIVIQHTEGIPAEEAIKFDYPNTLKALQREIEIDYKPTNADRIRSMSIEELAELLPIVSNLMCTPTDKCMEHICNRGECENTKECALKWLRSEAEGLDVLQI